MSRPPRAAFGFNLAFLDIMACGLGAVTLIFMLVKQHTAQSEEAESLQSQLESSQANIAQLRAQQQSAQQAIDALSAQLQQQTERAADQQRRAAYIADALIDAAKQTAALEKQIAPQQSSSQASQSNKSKPQQDHLIGLRVQGKRILILLDASASMADERLVDIIKIKASTVAVKKAAPKWRRTLAVVEWLLARVPEDGEYLIVQYNDRAEFLLDKRWRNVGEDAARIDVAHALSQLYPQRATNLHAALSFVQHHQLAPSDIYLITDSLPTQGELPVLRRVKACGAVRKSAVSGGCRLALFESAVTSHRARATVNTVLLPVEGDPQAAFAYWRWAASTGGVMISPAPSWP